jgi:hypothetical protein
VSDSLFWQDGFPKERRVELVANLLYAGDPNARIPNNEGLRPDRVEDFYRAAGFSSLSDFDARIDAIEEKYRYGEPVREVQIPPAQKPMVSVDPLDASFAPKKQQMQRVEAPVVVAEMSKPVRVRRPQQKTSEQPIVPVPKRRAAPVAETPAVESVPDLPTPNTQHPTPTLHPEDRISALARSVLTWFGRKPQHAEAVEVVATGAPEVARTRDVVSALLAKELGAKVFDTGMGNDPRAHAHVEAANRLERAIATSRSLSTNTRADMQERVGVLRSAYQERMETIARSRSAELQSGIDEAIMDERHGDALRVLAMRSGPIASDIAQFREAVEHAALQRGGAEAVAAVDAAFQAAWQKAWTGAVSPLEVGPLEASLPRLRLLEGGSRSGVGRLVAEARASVQEEIDRRLPMAERAAKRAA